MTNLEVVLGLALAGTVALLVRTHRKQLILRHLFMRSSDWCAFKIDDMEESATAAIIEYMQLLREQNGKPITREEALGSVPYVILDAKQNWIIQKEAFQADLVRNGIAPLVQSDLDDFYLTPGRAGYKDGPSPKYINR